MGDNNNFGDGTNSEIFADITPTSVSEDIAKFIDTLKSNLESSKYSDTAIQESINSIQQGIKAQLLELSKINEASAYTSEIISAFSKDGEDLKVYIYNGRLPQICSIQRARKLLLNSEFYTMSLDWEILPTVNQYCCNIYFLNLLGYNLTEYLRKKG